MAMTIDRLLITLIALTSAAPLAIVSRWFF
jgi:hypothetical protein